MNVSRTRSALHILYPRLHSAILSLQIIGLFVTPRPAVLQLIWCFFFVCNGGHLINYEDKNFTSYEIRKMNYWLRLFLRAIIKCAEPRIILWRRRRLWSGVPSCPSLASIITSRGEIDVNYIRCWCWEKEKYRNVEMFANLWTKSSDTERRIRKMRCWLRQLRRWLQLCAFNIPDLSFNMCTLRKRESWSFGWEIMIRKCGVFRVRVESPSSPHACSKLGDYSQSSRVPGPIIYYCCKFVIFLQTKHANM